MADDLIPVADPNVGAPPPQIPVSDPNITGAQPPPTPDIATNVTDKADFAFRNKNPINYDQVYGAIMNGQQPEVRRQMAATMDQWRLDRRNEIIKSYTQALGRPLTMDDLQQIDNEWVGKNDPNSVIEDHYAEQYMKYLNWNSKDGDDSSAFTLTAQSMIPRQYEFIQQTGHDILRTREFIQSLQQDAAMTLHYRGIVGTAKDTLLQFIPGYNEYNMRNLGGAGFFEGIGRGTNLDINTRAQLALPWEDRKAAILNTYNRLKQTNPQLAAEYLDALQGQSTDEVNMKNMFTLWDASALAPIAKLPLSIAREFSIAGRATRMVGGMARGIETGARTAQEAVAAAAGDLTTAAKTRVASNITSNTIDPTQQAVDYLHNFFKTKVDALYENIGTGMSMEQVRQIEARYNTIRDNLTHLLQGSIRPIHLPAEILDQIASHYGTDLDYYFPGLSNSILDISNPVRRPFTNTYTFDLRIGTPAKTLFESKEAAAGYAAQHGLWKVGKVEPMAETLSREDLTAALRQRQTDLAHLEIQANNPMLSRATRQDFAKKAAMTRSAIAHFQRRLTNFGIDGHGAGYFIRVTKPLDLTQTFIRNAIHVLAKEGESDLHTPDSWLKAMVGKFITPDETLSQFQRRNRGLAVHGPNALMEFAHDLGTDINELAKRTYPFTNRRQRWKDWEMVLAEQQRIPDPVDGVPGYTFRNPAELEYAYMRTLGRLPDEAEIKAYFAQKQLYEFDHVLRNISLYRNKHTVGSETHTLRIKNKAGKNISSKEIDGPITNQFPKPDGGNLVVFDQNGGIWGHDRPRQVNSFPKEKKAALEEAMAKGDMKMVHIYDEYDNPLKAFGGVADHSVRYAAIPTRQLSTRPLKWDQLKERGGGHFIYNYDMYLKQAVVDHEPQSFDKNGKVIRMRHIYKGDTTVMAVPVKAMGQDFATKLNAFRELLRARRYADAKAYLTANPLGIDYKDVVKWFKASSITKADGTTQRVKPWLDIHEPVVLTPRNRTISDLNNDLRLRYSDPTKISGATGIKGSIFSDGTKGGSLASQRQVAFTGERDSRELQTLTDIGGKGNPVYKFAPADKLTPINALNRAMSAVTNSLYVDEYRWTAMEHWLQEAAPYLKLRKNELESSPFAVFSKPDWKPVSTENANQISRLQVTHYQISQLAGRQSDTEVMLHSLAQKMADMVYKKLGPKGIIDPVWIAAQLKDPFRFLRSMTFHAQLGFFNLPQYVRQLQTFATIYGVAGPGRAGSGTLAALMHGWTKINSDPAILAGMDRVMTKFHIPGTSRWRPGEYTEATHLARETGAFVVAGEYAPRDDMWANKTVNSMGGKFLDAGTGFFRSSERMVRKGAFYTAYREFRDVHPTGALTDEDKLKIFARFRDLSVNMDRAANSMLQHGLGSVPLQFLTYQMRSGELFWGNRLTEMEKLRLFGTYAVIYGVPSGAAVTGFPFADMLKNKAEEEGYDVGNNWITDVLMQGVPSSMLAAATGNWYNIGEALGPQGWEPLREAMRGDRTIWSLALGAVGTTLDTAWAQSDGLRAMAMSAFADKDDVFPFVPEDVLDVFNTLSSVYHINQTYLAMTTGNWISRKGVKLDSSITPLNAILMYLGGGLGPERSASLDNMTQGLKSRKESQKKIEDFFTKEFRRGIDLAVAGPGYNPDEAQKHFTRAFLALRMGNYPREDWDKLLSMAEDGYKTMVERVSEEFWNKHVYENYKSTYLPNWQEALRRRIQK